jgi:ribosome-binding protein aMBF1 (putative translation factor)
MISPRQSKAARALLGWTQLKLSEKAGIPLDTVKRFERAKSDTRGKAMIKMEAALRQAGIKLLAPENGEGEGLRFASTKR